MKPWLKILIVFGVLAGFLAGVSSARADLGASDSGLPITDPSQPGEKPPGKLWDSILFFLTHFELFDSEEELDRAVGNPWELESSTRLKMTLLPVYVRFPIYQMIAGRAQFDDSGVQPLDQEYSDLANNGAAQDALVVYADGEQTEEMRKAVLSTLGGTFNAREIVDLAVFAMSGLSFFPKDLAGWHKLKGQIADADVYLALAVLVIGAATDQGQFSYAGKIVNLEKKGFKLGWYGSVKDLGASFHPRLRAGLNMELGPVELLAGWAEHIRPDPEDERRALEAAVRESWINRFTKPYGWDVHLEAGVRQILEAEEKYGGASTAARVGIYAKRDNLWEIPHLSFRGTGELETDFERNLNAILTLAFEDQVYGVAALLQGSASVNLETGASEYKAGIFYGGSIESQGETAKQRMIFTGRWLVEELDKLEALDKERRSLQSRVDLIGSGKLSPKAYFRAVQALGQAFARVEGRQLAVARRLTDYLLARQRYYRASGTPVDADGLHGPVPHKRLHAARELFFSRLTISASMVRILLQRVAGQNKHLSRLRSMRADLIRAGMHPKAFHILTIEHEIGVLINVRYRDSIRLGELARFYLTMRDYARKIDTCSNILPAHAPDPLGPKLTTVATGLAQF